MKLRLMNKERAAVAYLEVETREIATAACVVRDGRYYIYNNIKEGVLTFGEVDPPSNLDHLEAQDAQAE